MNVEHPTTPPHEEPDRSGLASADVYEIRISGRLDARWSSWFDGLAISTDADGTTVISGPVADQAALHGLLVRLRDLGLTLLSLRRGDVDAPLGSPNTSTQPTTEPPGAPS